MSQFTSNVLKLASGNIISQVVLIATMPIVTRLYTPSDFGIFALLTTIFLILGTASEFRFSSAVILPKDKKDAVSLMALSTSCATATALFLTVSIVLLICGVVPLNIFKLESVKKYLWVIPIGVFLRGAFPGYYTWSIRSKKFETIAIAKIFDSVCRRIFVICSGIIYNLGPFGLIFGHLIGAFVNIFILIRFTLKKPIRTLISAFSLKEFKRLSIRYKDFPLFGTWSVLIGNLSRELPVILIAGFFDPTIVGLYAFGAKLIRLPMFMLGQALHNVFLQRVVTMSDRKKALASETMKQFKRLLILFLPAFIILIFMADLIFGALFGAEWSKSGTFVRILAPSYLFLFLYQPMNAFYVAFERMRAQLIYVICFFFARNGALLAGSILTHSPEIGLLAMSTATCLVVIGGFIYIFRLIDISWFELLSLLFASVLLMLPLILGAGYFRIQYESSLSNAILVFVVALILQASLILYLNRNNLKEIKLSEIL